MDKNDGINFSDCFQSTPHTSDEMDQTEWVKFKKCLFCSVIHILP